MLQRHYMEIAVQIHSGKNAAVDENPNESDQKL